MNLVGEKAVVDFDIPHLRMSVVNCLGLHTQCIYNFIKDRPISDNFLGHCNPGQILRGACGEITLAEEEEWA